MKIKKGVTVYRCDYCKKKMFRKGAMERHERLCDSNPENSKACSGCSFLQETTVEVYSGTDPYGDERTRDVKAFRCTKLDKMLYPLKVEQKGLVEKYPDTFEDQEPMPKECEHREFIW